MTTASSATGLQPQLALAARILLVAIFLVSGIRKIVEYPVFVAFIGSKGIPFPELCAALACVLEIAGSVMLLLGWKARQAAFVLAVYTVFLAFGFHDFWTMQTAGMPAAQASNQMNHFLKNITIAGGLLMLAAMGPGAWSLDMRNKVADPKGSPQRA